MSISVESAKAWVANKLVNPDTNKKITKNGPKYKEFLQAAKDHGLPLSVKVFKKTFPKSRGLDEMSMLFIQNGTYMANNGYDHSPHMMWWTGQKFIRTEQGFTARVIEGFRIGFKLDPMSGKVTVIYDPDHGENYWKVIGKRLGKIVEQTHVMDS